MQNKDVSSEKAFLALNKRMEEIIDRLLGLENKVNELNERLNQHDIDPYAHKR